MKIPNPSIYPILLIFLLTTLQTQSECPICINLSFNSCKICYNMCPFANLKNLFLKCDYTYCSAYSNSENGTSICIANETKQLSEKQCFSQCCKIEVKAFSVSVLKQCQEKKSQKKNNTTIIIVVVISSVAGATLTTTLICCGCFGQLCQCLVTCCGSLCECLGGCGGPCECLGDCGSYKFKCKCCRRAPQAHPPANMEITSAHLSRTYIWHQSPQRNQLIQDETCICSICLANRANTINKCGHCFHLDCISEWLKRNPHCPVCRSQDAHFVKFYCRGCCSKYIEFDLAVEKKPEKALQDMKGPNCEVCQ